MKTTLAICAASLMLTLPATAATIVQNGSFDTGVPGDVAGNHNGQHFGAMPASGAWDIWSEINGWKTVSGDGIEVQTNGTISEVDAQQGNYYLELDARGNSTMEQMVQLAKGSYILSFYYSPRSYAVHTNEIFYSVGDLFENYVTGPGGRQGTVVGQWTLFSMTFDVFETGSYALRFGALGTSDGYGGLIDNVSIVSAVPVPAAGLLMAGALGGLVAARRRRT